MKTNLDMSRQEEIGDDEEKKMNPWVKRILIILGILIVIGGVGYWIYVAP